MIPLSKHKCHENKKDTKIENNLYTLLKTEQSRYFERNLVCQKSMTLAINEKTRLALLIVGEISNKMPPVQQGTVTGKTTA